MVPHITTAHAWRVLKGSYPLLKHGAFCYSHKKRQPRSRPILPQCPLAEPALTREEEHEMNAVTTQTLGVINDVSGRYAFQLFTLTGTEHATPRAHAPSHYVHFRLV